ncbi:hypothetical protein FNW02_11430 [Komarekiella sp. 'clone 1']|uniref:Uncharacterized protein n=1 Tax=Komarekiella delphini-convector SJRDD-AB1 TaxID=2593771 RepID=A0AA40SWJ1_9NOST|nr:hypothetical protein [Komarekiella delphini-convector]MBD6616430.1 hypothetical protein [Komarekiella delphini-convector SJRDD-AB1]
MNKYVIFVLLLILSISVALPSYASVCRNHGGQQICILSINRSAKNYWEYRATVSVNGVRRPIEVYNCREQVKVQQDGTVLPFKQKDPGKLICSFFNSSVR